LTQDPNIYIKKIEDVGKYTIWLVNGEYIRKNLNENFVEYDRHYHLPFIPVNEFWIDQNTNPDEWFFWVEHFIKEQAELDKGLGYEAAKAIGDRAEKKQRMTVLHIGQRKPVKESREDILKEIHQTLLTDYPTTNLKIWLIDGKVVRDHYLLDYADGGHDRVYDFIPDNEIWLENTLSKAEIPFILVHELHERFLMGQGKDYPHAHRGATIIEDHYRDNPKEVAARIIEEIAKNEQV
jgi:hypothetical protein